MDNLTVTLIMFIFASGSDGGNTATAITMPNMEVCNKVGDDFIKAVREYNYNRTPVFICKRNF